MLLLSRILRVDNSSKTTSFESRCIELGNRCCLFN